MKVALTIAGSDSGGGAGVQADLKAFSAHGVFGASVITAITAQNTVAVTAAYDLPVPLIEAQIDAVLDDLPVDVVKTGMLSSSAIIEAVAARLAARPRALVVDPVMISKSGFALLADDAVSTLRARLLPLATVITPNAHEAARLTGKPVRDAAEAEEAARRLGEIAPAVLVKGGHLDGEAEAIDVLWDGHLIHKFEGPRITTTSTHGTGCTYASAIAANLAKGHALADAVEQARRYVSEAIRHGLQLGRGHGPTHHFWFLEGRDLFPYRSKR